MLVIALSFSAGRFHANPWGRHVNEGVAEWPPSPYRLIRSLYDAWKRRFPEWPPSRVEPVFRQLASAPPKFRLPPASAAHTRSFLSRNTGDVSEKTLIFDAFVVVDPRDSVLMVWDAAELSPQESADLQVLLASINYLGRSESWFDARVLEGIESIQANCVPASDWLAGRGEPIPVACPRPGQGGKWLEEFAFSTADLIAKKRSDPPALLWVEYLRDADCFAVRRRAQAIRPATPVSSVLFALHSKVLPRTFETLKLAERVRAKLMGIYRKLIGDPDSVSPCFSGKDATGKPLSGHRHAFFLPLDLDRDGRIDHFMVAAHDPFDALELHALDLLTSTWQPDGKPDLKFILLRRTVFGDSFRPSRAFRSVTPFVTSRHHRDGRGTYSDWLASELALECSRRGMPPPVKVEPLPADVLRDGRGLRWLDFRRNRKDDSPLPGYGFHLAFEHPIGEPIALGYGSHFGLGLFLPDSDPS